MAIGIIKYRMVQRINPQNKGEQPKWYGKAVQDRTIEFDDLVAHVSDHNSPYSRGVIAGVLTDMLDCVKELVLDGKSVRLGDLGLLSVGIKSKGTASRDKWNAGTHVEGVTLNLRNTKAWSNAELRNQASFQELTAYVKPEGEDDGDGTDDGMKESPDDNIDNGGNPDPDEAGGNGGGGSSAGAEQVFIGTSVNDTSMGSVTGMGTYAKGTAVTLTAKANSGYRFVSWSDEVTDNPRTVVAEVDGASYAAIFEAV